MPDQDALSAALEAFETNLETPIVPGELSSWVSNAQETCEKTVAALQGHVPTWHAPILEQIARQDPEMSSRVAQLREEDTQLLKQSREIHALLDKLADDAEALASHSPSVQRAVRECIQAGLEWIIRVRKQEAALTTWYQESFNRDRGVAD